jgi:hypothetical protein
MVMHTPNLAKQYQFGITLFKTHALYVNFQNDHHFPRWRHSSMFYHRIAQLELVLEELDV